MLEVCKTIYGNERGAALQSYLEGATGQPCPCRQGQICPLMPRQREGLDDTIAPVVA